MHVRKRALRLLSAVALVTFALPLAVNGSPPVSAQTTATQPAASIADVASVAPPVAINPIGTEHTVTFTCGAQSFASTTATGTAFVAPGCYNVQASVTDITSGAATAFDSAICGGVAAPSGSGTVNCGNVRSPICPTGTVAATGTALTATSPCVTSASSTAATPDISNNVVVTINPGAPHAYVINFTGYTPTTAAGSCPAGTTLVTGITLPVTTGTTTTPTLVGPTSACRFSVEAQKKYAEVTSIVLTPVNACGGTLTFAEGLKSFFGPPCIVNVAVTGTVILKTGITCGNGTEPTTGTAAPAEFGSGATYQCSNGTLSVVGVTGPAPGQTSLAGVRLAPNGGTGVGSFVQSGSLGTLCAGTTNTNATAPVFVTTISGVNTPTGTAQLCPTGPGAASLQLCLVGPDGTASSLPNNQPPLCSNTITANFTQRTERVVPYVRWAGEKVELTKCFGVGLAGSPVEFTLKSIGGSLNATLIPASIGSITSLPSGTTAGFGGTGAIPSQNTIWTTTDSSGCATILGLADGEGVMQVDAAIFNSSAAGAAAGTPIVNEHAFEVFYLKFDHVDLENIKFQTYTVAQALQPYLGFLTKTPALNGGAAANASFSLPGPPGTGSVAGSGSFGIPLCAPDFVRAMVHGYFEYPGDPSGRPAAQVAIPGASGLTGSAGSYVLPAGRWTLPEDWPLLATFAGFSGSAPLDITPSSVFAWDLNSGWVYNPAGESPVVCGLAAGVTGSSGLLLGGAPTPTAQTYGSLPVGYLGSAGSSDVGPCFGQDVTQVGSTSFYATAPGSLTPAQQASYPFKSCLTGFTAGFGPFDATRSCTDPFPLTLTPAGASMIGTGTSTCGTGISACLVPTRVDSTYLPNGTLNEWDAPMPPAQISFGITSGPGFLGQVNKTNLYQIRFDAGAIPSGSSACPTGYTLYSGTNTCQLELDPNPFYAEAIPASAFIPPVTNNGGYLWNSFNFSAGTTTVVSSTPAFAGAPAGGFVAGQSTMVPFTATAASPCPTLSSAPSTTVGATCNVAGGVNLLSAGSTSTTPTSIVVADGRGFLPNQTVEIYNNTTGATLGTATVTAVLPSPRTVNGVSYPNAVELQFAATPTGLTGTFAPGSVTVVSTLFGLPVPGAGAFSVGQQLTVGNPASSTQATSTVAAIDTTNNIVYVSNAELIARTLGNCLLSRTPVGSGTGGAVAFGNCEPNALVTAGTVINSGPVGAQTREPVNNGGNTGLYPFWQWVPAPPSSTQTPTTATVYSDNHGEAVVSLNTSVQSQVAPSSTGTCPTGYTPVTSGNPPTTTSCLLQLGALGSMNIGNGSLGTVKAALAAFSASNPGCIQTFPSGTYAALSGVTVGATGPAAGQICVNSLGGVEFGANATLGTTQIVAVADYPYTRGEHPQIASPTLNKVFQSGFAKTLTVSSGTAAPAGTTSYTVTVTATDVCGNPITNEPVNVYAISATNAVVLAPVTVGAVLQSSTNSASVLLVPSGANAGTGTFSLEVLNSAIGNQGLVVKAVFPAESIERFVTVISGTPVGQNTTVVYSPGWQQVGGPAGSNFSTVEALFSYDTASGQYTNATASAGNVSSAAPTCSGYWGYFAAAMTVTLQPTSKSGDTAACTLASGYNLVGNSFGSIAKLPSGVTAYHWNGTSYDTVSTIGVGQSVWVFNDGTLNSLTLTAT